MGFQDRIPATNYTTNVHLRGTEEGLELTADVGDVETTVVLDEHDVRKLRLALARYERSHQELGPVT
jgi:hypothetical protein